MSKNDQGVLFSLNIKFMLQKILQLNGVTLLDKGQQEMVKGGEDFCWVNFVHSSGTNVPELYWSPFTNNGESNAQSTCANAMAADSNITSCHYDCWHDGWQGAWHSQDPPSIAP